MPNALKVTNPIKKNTPPKIHIIIGTSHSDINEFIFASYGFSGSYRTSTFWLIFNESSLELERKTISLSAALNFTCG